LKVIPQSVFFGGRVSFNSYDVSGSLFILHIQVQSLNDVISLEAILQF